MFLQRFGCICIRTLHTCVTIILGLAPEGVVRSSRPAVAPRGDTVFVTVHWDVGTDIELDLDFGDGTALFSWNWQVRVFSWNWQVCVFSWKWQVRAYF